MAVSAAQIQYRQEMIAAFETGQSILRDTCTTEAVMKGNQATFLVSGSGGASAVTRGVNGLIPGRTDSNTQTTITLEEWHDKPQKTDFDVFASQGNQRSLMQRTSVEVINRKINEQILTALNTGTVNTGTATTASQALVLRAYAILQNAKVPWDRNVFGVISPSFNAYLMTVESYANADYVNTRPWIDNDAAWQDRPNVKHWAGVNWITCPDVPGVGTSAEKCFMFHKTAIGHAAAVGDMNVSSGYNDEDHYWYTRASIYCNAGVLQNAGIVVMNHDGSAMVAA